VGYGCIVGGRDCSGLTTDIEMNDYDVDVASARISYDAEIVHRSIGLLTPHNYPGHSAAT